MLKLNGFENSVSTAECLEYALENNIQGGIFGGVSELARQKGVNAEERQ